MGERSIPWLALLAVALGSAFVGPARSVRPGAAQAEVPRTGGVTRVAIDRELDTGTLSLLRRAIDHARETDDLLVVELDTPGGDVELMWQIAGALGRADRNGVVTVAWIHDRALSAGALVALACSRMYTTAQGSIGSALPVKIGLTGLEQVSPDEEVREKILSYHRSEFRAIAELHGRSGELAEAMVDPRLKVVQIRRDGALEIVSGTQWDDLRDRGERVEFVDTVCAAGELLNATGREAVRLGLADGFAETPEELYEKLGVPGAVVTNITRTPSEDWAGLLTGLGPLFLILGFVFAYVEFKVPGFGVPGLLSIASFGLFLFGRYLVGLADIPHIVLISVGVLAIALELFLFPGTLWPALLGVLLVLVGVVWSFVSAGIGLEESLDRQIVLGEALRVLGSALVALLCGWGFSRYLPRTSAFARLAVAPSAEAAGFAGAMPEASGAHATVARVGARGVALTPLRPVGKVVLDADATLEFEARSDGPEIEARVGVRVVEVHPSGRLVVEAVSDEAT